MGDITEKFNTAFRDNPVVGVPASGPHEPIKREIRAIALPIEANIAAAALAGTDLTAAMTLVAPLLSSAQSAQAAAEQAKSSLDQAIVAIPTTVAAQLGQAVEDATSEANVSRDLATTAASAAQVFVGGKLYDSSALGLAGTTNGQFFAVPNSPRRTTVDVYKNQSGTAVKQITYGSKLVSADEFASPSDATTYAQSVGADVFLPASDFTGNVPDTSDAIFDGDGRLFNSAGVQISTYAEPRSRFVIGQARLWGFHYAALNGLLAASKPIIFTGDSTTRGAFAQSAGGSLPERDRIHRINEDQMVRYGIYGPTSINSGMDGVTTREWLNGVQIGGVTRGLDYDIATYPAMSLYVIRFGINDGSLTPTYHDIAAYRRDIRAGLQRLRGWKDVGDLPIVLMAPSSVSETGARDEAWMEQVTRVLKKAAQDFECCFIDTYGLWREARGSAIGRWRDNVNGAGIHPDGVANRLIMNVFGEVVYKPISTRGIATNTFLNAPGSATRPVTASAAPNDPLFATGDCTYRTDVGNTFPLDGHVRTFKTGDGPMVQENFGYATTNTQRTYTRYGNDGGAWSDWCGLDYVVPFTKDNGSGGLVATGWSDFNAGTPPLAVNKSVEGTVLLHGRVKNTAATAGSVIGTLPAGYRPLIVKFFSTGNGTDATRGQISINSAGTITWLSGMAGDVTIDICLKAFG